MTRALILAAVLGLTACAGQPRFDGQNHYLPHDHAAHYVSHQPLGKPPAPARSPRHSQDGVPMRMSAGTRSAYLPEAGPSLVGGQTQLQQHMSALAHRLVSSAHDMNRQAAIAVSGFVSQEDYTSQDEFGRLLSETMMFQLNQHGLKVVDFKALPFIRITPEGDVSTSRDYRQLSGRINAQYLLHGTISQTQGGRLINARLISMADHGVVSSAQQFVPDYLVAAMLNTRGPEIPDHIRRRYEK
ncbi:FlgO family outer membrane protein [Oceanimonas sp. CHS3-5]|uniref:FlgO family outer membrane protein n=1 Tax=Oceanimonas sp. CHS3-5 TaxID=3068186 RepID=UPI00273F6F87|nr:FlgO family outer membrane protein [Oceanimonas sp. CHS3-5]MDP5292302.1 FlgO family outer membrane protein [Oceanimonas sp. CHS3-5]